MKPGDPVDLTILVSPRKIDHIMHAAGMFTANRRLICSPLNLTGRLEAGHTLADVITNARKVINGDGEYEVLAIFQAGDPEGAWYNTDVQTISNGETWGLLLPYLKQRGFTELVNSPGEQSQNKV